MAKSLSPGSDRRKWQKIYETLLNEVRSQQATIETLTYELESLEQYMGFQQNQWACETELLRSHITQIRNQDKKGRRVQAATLDLMVGMKQRDALRYKKRLEQAENDLVDFHAYVEALMVEIAELKEKLKSSGACKVSGRTGYSEPVDKPHGDKKSTAALKGELRKLKHSYKDLSAKKDAEVAALLSEKDFVWYQLNTMDNNYTSLLKSKRIEVEQANETIQKLELNIRNLQLSIIEKSETIARLETDRARLESDLRRQTQQAEKTNHESEKLQLVVEKLQSSIKEKDEIIEELKINLPKIEQNVARSTNKKSRFFTEQDSKRKSKASVVTPDGRQPRRNSRNGSENSEASSGKKRRCAYQDSCVSHASSSTHGPQPCSSGKRTRTVSPTGSSRLFSANFKVPKLKSTSPTIS